MPMLAGCSGRDTEGSEKIAAINAAASRAEAAAQRAEKAAAKVATPTPTVTTEAPEDGEDYPQVQNPEHPGENAPPPTES
ncbi:hypothetical protein [Novosphingobium sp. B 225]|uniref:hypothetical protein n=1 Tax=Novosphingobium sp. B 225 TaxID=1961849 RepID=UPI001124E2D5|nr:hypothetical protein [Novosphingobium sp. B 225]